MYSQCNDRGNESSSFIPVFSVHSVGPGVVALSALLRVTLVLHNIIIDTPSNYHKPKIIFRKHSEESVKSTVQNVSISKKTLQSSR